MRKSLKFIVALVAFISVSFITPEKKEINIVIDAGHGGHDHGGTINEITEKSLTATISSKINELNTDSEIKIHFTHEEDTFIGLLERAEFINTIKPDLTISLHANFNKNTTTNGFEIFVSNTSIASLKSKELADKLALSFSEKLPLVNRGVKTAPFMVLKKSEYPTMLIEMGFITNKNDRNYLTSESGQNEIAKTILDFVSEMKL